MTLDEAWHQIDRLGRPDGSAPVSQQEVLCPETQVALRILSAAYERVQKRDPLYGESRRTGVLRLRPGVCYRVDGARNVIRHS